MIESERIDSILTLINNGKIIGKSNYDIPTSTREIISIMVAYDLITLNSRDIAKLTQNGYDAIALGGFDNWHNKEKNGKSSQNIHIYAPITNSQIGSHGSVVENLTKTQPNQKVDDKHKNNMSISIAQFIFWLFTAFGVGITIGYNVFYTLRKWL